MWYKVIYSYYLEVGKDLSVNFVDRIQVPNLVMLPELGCVIYLYYTLMDYMVLVKILPAAF